jgi:nucleoside-diphosphate-sugar epimerase
VENRSGSMEIVDSSNKKSLLLIGGAGFIGNHITKEALFRGFRVTVISKNFKPPSERLESVDYLELDISVPDNLINQLGDKVFHYVINLGGYIDHSGYFDGGDNVIDVHFNGTKNLVNYLNRDNLISFIQIGSSDEYGNNPAPQSEDMRELPISPYSFAKTAATNFLQMLHTSENFPAVVLRPFLVYGPGQDNKRFIPQIIYGCLNDFEFPVSYGDQLRDFCFISDIVDAIFLTLNNSNIYGEVINIGSGDLISIKEIIINIQKIIGMGRPQFGKISYRVGENMELYADTNKAKNLLKWESKVSLKTGLKKTINFYRSND